MSRQYNLLDIPALHGVHSHGGGASGGELVGTGPLQLATDDGNDDEDIMDGGGDGLDVYHGPRAEEAAGAEAADPTPSFGTAAVQTAQAAARANDVPHPQHVSVASWFNDYEVILPTEGIGHSDNAAASKEPHLAIMAENDSDDD